MNLPRTREEHKRDLDSNMDLFYEKHPKPSLIYPKEIDLLPDFAETFKGVMRDKVLNPLNI